MSPLCRRFFCLILTLCLLSLPVLPAAVKNWQWHTDGRVIAIADVHGAFDELVTLLQGLHLANAAGHWTGGSDHLVMLGDVLDRGAAARDALALVMRLQTEAEQAGGMVHFILGNHEIMNLVGDLRYVTVDEFARYLDVEDAQDRSREFQKYVRHGQDRQLDEAALLNSFRQTYPPGFFGHHQLFSAEGKYGKWLLARPVIIKINDSVFVHGGLSPAVSGLGLGEINDLYHRALRDYILSREYFTETGVLEAATNFYDQPGIIKQVLNTLSPDAREQAGRLLDAYSSHIFDPDSPTWYRGNIGCSAAIEANRLRLQLAARGARRLIVGHTPTPSHTIESRFDDMFIRADAGMLNAYFYGQPAALIIRGNKPDAYYPNWPADQSITRQARQVGPRPGGVTDRELERVLAMAPIRESESRRGKATLLTLDYKGHPVRALFSATHSAAPFFPEVAAYRLDRYLGLEMTPVAVVRTIAGSSGSITLNLDKLIDEGQRVARHLGSAAWCPLQDQFNMMYLFDILLHNRGRGRHAMRYGSGDFRLILTGNRNILDSGRTVPRYLKSAAIRIPADLKAKLQALDAPLLAELLGDVLGAKRRKAILARRDLLLKRAK